MRVALCCVLNRLESINQSINQYLINGSKEKRIKATAKGMDGQIKLTTYTIPAHHKTHTNLLKSLQTNFKRI